MCFGRIKNFRHCRRAAAATVSQVRHIRERQYEHRLGRQGGFTAGLEGIRKVSLNQYFPLQGVGYMQVTNLRPFAAAC